MARAPMPVTYVGIMGADIVHARHAARGRVDFGAVSCNTISCYKGRGSGCALAFTRFIDTDRFRRVSYGECVAQLTALLAAMRTRRSLDLGMCAAVA